MQETESSGRFRTLPRRLDVHDDDDVQDHRAGLVDADDLERLAADVQGIADLLGLALRVGVLAGDLAADDDVRLALVLRVEERPSPFSLRARGKTALRRF